MAPSPLHDAQLLDRAEALGLKPAACRVSRDRRAPLVVRERAEYVVAVALWGHDRSMRRATPRT